MSNTKKIMSLQDISCYGQCSLTVALPVLSAYGIETAILPSAILSTHTAGFKDFTCLDLTDEIPAILNHWINEGIRYDAIYTGYIGDARQFAMIEDNAASLLKPDGQLIVDPAMADNGKLYPALNEDIVLGMRRLVRSADIILPNLTEAAFLSDEPWSENCSREQAKKMLSSLCDMGPDISVLTGVSFEPGTLGAVALKKSTGEYCEYFTQRIMQDYHGTGDIFSSVVIANLLNGTDLEAALKDACEFVVESIQNTIGDDTHNYGVKFESVLAQRRAEKQ